MSDASAPGPRDPGALMFALIDMGAQLQARLEEALGAAGLSLAKHGVLATLAEAGPPMTLGELADHQKCVRSNITQLVDRLEHDGLVRREHDATDRRSVRAVLTDEGRTRERAGAEAIERVKAAFLEAIPSVDREALGRLIDQVR